MTIIYKNESFDICVDGNDITLQGLHSDIILTGAYPKFELEAREACDHNKPSMHEYEKQNLQEYVERLLIRRFTEIKVINHSIN